MIVIRCCNQPPRQLPSGTKRPKRQLPKIINKKTIKTQIEHARMICTNFEDSFECSAAWEHVQELEDRLNQIEDALKYMELEEWVVPESDVKNREYDL
jgi:CP12 domain